VDKEGKEIVDKLVQSSSSYRMLSESDYSTREAGIDKIHSITA